MFDLENFDFCVTSCDCNDREIERKSQTFQKICFIWGYLWKVCFSFVLMWFVVAVFAGYAVVRTWNFHIWNNGNDQGTRRKSQTFQRNTALINGNTFAFDEQHCKCFSHNIYRDKYTYSHFFRWYTLQCLFICKVI